MAAPKGTRPPAAGMGRKLGSKNKITREFRETVKSLLEDNAENVAKWLAMVAEGDDAKGVKSDPGRALDLMSKLAEYATPKLGRIEHTGEMNHSVNMTVSQDDADV